jgi:hypothetical protein
VRAVPYLFLLCIPAVPLVQRQIDARLGEFRAQEEVLYISSGAQVRRVAAGLEDLMADIYWLRTVQYYGGQRAYAKDKRFDLLRPLVDITVTLDPRLEIAYHYGAVFLAEPRAIGAGQPEAAIELLERGRKAMPQNWRLAQELGFFKFFYLHDAQGASRVLLEASRIPGAPYWLQSLAADILARGGERELSRQIWLTMYRQGEEGAIKQNALSNLQRLDALDRIDALKAAVEEFTRRTGRRPRNLDELSASGLTSLSPIDPTGIPFDYDADSGVISISNQSSVWRP